MNFQDIIPNQINILQKKYNVTIETLDNTKGLEWEFLVSPTQPQNIIDEINDVLDDTLDVYEDAISSFFTLDGHYFANVKNKES